MLVVDNSPQKDRAAKPQREITSVREAKAAVDVELLIKPSKVSNTHPRCCAFGTPRFQAAHAPPEPLPTMKPYTHG